MLAWHVAVTKPFAELVAERQLAKQPQFQPFNPKVQITKVVRNREHVIRAPYIPGYIFVRFDVDDDRWKTINTTRGIHQLMLAAPDKPATVRDEAMAVLLDRCSGSDIVSASVVDHALAKLIPVGAMVTLKPLDLDGTVELSQNDRLTIVMSFLGALRRVTVPRTLVALRS